jgi:DtxR family manganese transport transcriptional regulator
MECTSTGVGVNEDCALSSAEFPSQIFGEALVVPKADSEPHQRTRRDHATENAEDYVEAIAEIESTSEVCRLVDLARRFAVTHVTANRIVARLAKEGLVETQPYQPITLTRKGRSLARRCRKRHEIVFRFLRCIGVDEKTAAIDAEGIEHHVSPSTLELFHRIAKKEDT